MTPQVCWEMGACRTPWGSGLFVAFPSSGLSEGVMCSTASLRLLCQGRISYSTAAQPGVLPPEHAALHHEVHKPQSPLAPISELHAGRQRWEPRVTGCISHPFAAERHVGSVLAQGPM